MCVNEKTKKKRRHSMSSAASSIDSRCFLCQTSLTFLLRPLGWEGRREGGRECFSFQTAVQTFLDVCKLIECTGTDNRTCTRFLAEASRQLAGEEAPSWIRFNMVTYVTVIPKTDSPKSDGVKTFTGDGPLFVFNSTNISSQFVQ